MKSFVLFLTLLLPSIFTAQTTQGKVIYNETMKLEIDIPEEHREQLKGILPDSREAKKILMFDASESIYKDYEAQEDDVIEAGSEESGMHMKMIIQKTDNQVYKNTEEKQLIEKQEFFGRNFLIVDKVEAIIWKLTNEQKEILGYTCQKATADNDEQSIEAWFSPQIPVANGPMHYGDLPGLILEINIGGGETHIVASDVQLGDVEEKIAAPDKGKKVSREEFKKIVDEKTKEMEEEYGSGKGRMIIKTNRN
jgi:GLPGLI family protein